MNGKKKKKEKKGKKITYNFSSDKFVYRNSALSVNAFDSSYVLVFFIHRNEEVNRGYFYSSYVH